MRTAHPFLLSLLIHLAVGVLIVAVVFTLKRVIPTPQEKIALKLFEPPQEDSQPLPPPQRVAVPEPEPIATPKPQPVIPKPVQSAPVQSKPSPLPAAPAAPVAVTTPKTVESSPVIPLKATPPPPPPPPPKIEENYAEENLGRIRTILNERKTYPKNAKRLNQQGEVTVTFTLSVVGETSAIVITESSGFDLLDDAAKELIISSASEFPKPKKPVRISVPIGYKLR